MGKYSLIKFISELLMGLGFIFSISPIIFYIGLFIAIMKDIFWIINGAISI
ncbi:hypothetical protein SAMN05660242_2144 [Thermoanaerobacterium sp. RBIITD]|nr:hypothetical protein SAMN05660242_2144 [Thermoanaerobacterium sp. RBIITD]